MKKGARGNKKAPSSRDCYQLLFSPQHQTRLRGEEGEESGGCSLDTPILHSPNIIALLNINEKPLAAANEPVANLTLLMLDIMKHVGLAIQSLRQHITWFVVRLANVNKVVHRVYNRKYIYMFSFVECKDVQQETWKPCFSSSAEGNYT